MTATLTTQAKLGQVRIPPRKSKSGQVRILPIDSIRPSPENEKLYRPVDANDPEVNALAQSIREYGIREPLVISEDGYILSGHRRYVAAKLAGLTEVPCRVEPIRRDTDPDRFLVLLREYNRQRVKSFDEKLHEEIVSADPEEAYQALIDHRREQSEVNVETIELRERKTRARISDAKQPFLDAVLKVIEDRRNFWPLSDRQIHYALLNDPPLIHARKPGSKYTNNLQSYKALTDLLLRARLEQSVGWETIADETRPTTVWNVHRDVQSFIREELNGFLKSYWRDLMQSQPNHIEIIGEKLTIKSVVDSVGARYTVLPTIGRGFASGPPRRKLVERFQRSGKRSLILLILSDFDPDGEEIAHSFARSIRDDFGIEEVVAVKVALTSWQVDNFNLPPSLKAKKTSSRYGRFAKQHGDYVWELEALPPETLQQLLIEALDSAIDVVAFNAEIDAEKRDAAHLAGVRSRVLALLKEMEIVGLDSL